MPTIKNRTYEADGYLTPTEINSKPHTSSKLQNGPQVSQNKTGKAQNQYLQLMQEPGLYFVSSYCFTKAHKRWSETNN